MGTIVNPKPFVKGFSGNPGGRPKGRSITGILRDILASDTLRGEKMPRGLTVAETLAEVLVVQAIGGDVRCQKEILDRVDGKVTDRHEIALAPGTIEPDPESRARASTELAEWREGMRRQLVNVMTPPPPE